MKHPITGDEVNEVNSRADANAVLTVTRYALAKAIETLSDIQKQFDGFDHLFGFTQPPTPAAPSGSYRYKGQTVKGSPEHSAKMTRALNSYWAGKSPKQRSIEMKRRMRVAQGLEPSKRAGIKTGLKRKSTAGLKRGSPEFREVDAWNKRVLTAEKRAASGISGTKSAAQTRWDRASEKEKKLWKKKMKLGKERAAAKARVDQLVNGIEVTQ
jgi:hypothetical protein